MKSLPLLIALSALCVHAWDPDSSRIMAGWDDGPSIKWRALRSYWIGFNGMPTDRENQENFDNKFPGASTDAPAKLENGHTRMRTKSMHCNLVLEREIRAHRYVFLDPFVSAGYTRSTVHTDWSAYYDYPPIQDRESQEVNLSVGVMPGFRILDRLRLSLRFAAVFSREWGDETTEYLLASSPEVYHRNMDFESTEYEYSGATSLYYTNLILHWVF
ncbi:MAG TPA: hypothetical protein VJ385_01580 [Fibrobacteria bacterium]|nr:hypothetical protein [Fibrobacteria bacterium]